VIRLAAIFALGAALLAPVAVRADGLSEDEILGPPQGFHVQSVRARYTHFDQDGHGFQSQAGRTSNDMPGLETVTVEQPQLEIIATQGEKITHRLWLPVDIITAASPDALDAVSTASRQNEAGSVDLSTTYKASKTSSYFTHVAFHLEEPFRSWLAGFGGSRSFAEDNTVVSYSVNQVFDWLDRFNVFGTRLGRDYRSSTNANIGVTQLLSPTTIGHLEYGVTVQVGELSNTWNAVAIDNGELDRERLPNLRHRHAFVGRLAQALPWKGAVQGFYRFYVDNWGIIANTLELALYQHVTRFAYLKASYRYHNQTAPPFWTTLASANAQYRTSDSDLGAFSAQTIGIAASADLPFVRSMRGMHFDFGYERYFRTNDLNVNVYTCSVGFLF
jgi:hypothetical protein